MSGPECAVLLRNAFLDRKLDKRAPEGAECRPQTDVGWYQLTERLRETNAIRPSRQAEHKFGDGSCVLMDLGRVVVADRQGTMALRECEGPLECVFGELEPRVVPRETELPWTYPSATDAGVPDGSSTAALSAG
jgi:hypothetical protein